MSAFTQLTLTQIASALQYVRGRLGSTQGDALPPVTFEYEKVIGVNSSGVMTDMYSVSNSIPQANTGSGSAGTSYDLSRGDHAHPVDSTRAPIANPSFTGNVSATGFIHGIKCGVSAYLDTPAATTIITAGTYYPIAGTFTNSPIEQFTSGTVYAPSIKYTGSYTQYFEIDWHATVTANNASTTVSIGVKKNGTLVAGSVMSNMLKTAAESYSYSGTCVVGLATNDEIQLVITTDGSGDIITTNNFTTTISEFFK